MDAVSTSAPTPEPRTITRARALWVLLGVALLSLTVLSGLPRLDAEWIQGDERRFISENPDVTGTGDALPLSLRAFGIFTHYHEDLYQPVPILTYALEWAFWPESIRIPAMRMTDVVLHGINGLVLWSLLVAIMRRLFGTAEKGSGTYILPAFVAALLWTLHPLQVSAYSADMGRTHLLSALLTMLSLRAYLKHMDARANQLTHGPFTASMLWLVLAMMSKPVPGIFAIIFVLEWHANGLTAAFRRPGPYLCFAQGILFAIITLDATQSAFQLEDFEDLLYGTPLSRSALAFWIYFRNLVTWPLIAPAYLPIPAAEWGSWQTAVGAALALLTIGAIGLTLFRGYWRVIALGLIWYWVLLFPVIGLVGARVNAANDRYVYQPLMGFALLLAAALACLPMRQSAKRAATVRAIGCAGFAAIALLAVPTNQRLCAVERTVVERAERVVELHPGDPRAYEIRYIAYLFAHDETPASNRAQRDALWLQAREARDIWIDAATENDAYLRNPRARAGFHRRAAEALLIDGQNTSALEHARAAGAADPEEPLNWTTQADALRRLGDLDTALEMYQAAEPRFTPDHGEFARQMYNYGQLLLTRGDASAARPRLELALRHAREDELLERLATLDLALAEVRGEAVAAGLTRIEGYLLKSPTDLKALRILAEALDRSGAAEARTIYIELHRLALERGSLRVALEAWQQAVALVPADRTRVSFLAFTEVVRNVPGADERCAALLELDPTNPFAAAGHALACIRRGDISCARRQIEAAATGVPLDGVLTPETLALHFERLIDVAPNVPALRLAAAALWSAADDHESAQRMLADLPNELSPEEGRWAQNLRNADASLTPETPPTQ